MTKKTFELVNSIVGGVATIVTGIVAYFVTETSVSAGICSGIVALTTIISDIMGAFIKEGE